MKILVTGGLGYIGSNVCVHLIQKGFEPIVVDNLSNTNLSVLKDIQSITSKKLEFYEGDIRSKSFLENVFAKHNFFAVMHFAGLKVSNESIRLPLDYYDNNVLGSLNLFDSMIKNNVKNIVFSSSAATYGNPKYLPIDENHELEPINPYGSSKMVVENILSDIKNSDSHWSIVALRYFNPVGTYSSGLLGDNPNKEPTNIMPFLSKVAKKNIEKLIVFGSDYDTIDGTGVRDYIHVSDLAEGHISALEYIIKNKYCYEEINLGSGNGVSVLELITCYEKINNLKINYEIGPRRNGDTASSYASAAKAKNLLKWECKKSLEDMCLSAHEFEKNNN